MTSIRKKIKFKKNILKKYKIISTFKKVSF